MPLKVRGYFQVPNSPVCSAEGMVCLCVFVRARTRTHLLSVIFEINPRKCNPSGRGTPFKSSWVLCTLLAAVNTRKTVEKWEKNANFSTFYLLGNNQCVQYFSQPLCNKLLCMCINLAVPKLATKIGIVR